MASTSAAKQSSAMKQFPNWLELPHDLMANILQRLRTAEILGARKVCTTWRRSCKDPALWKVIDINKLYDDRDTDYGLETLTKQAVHLSCGELIDISISGFGTDGLVDLIVLRSSKLNRLSLWDCYDITGSGLSRAVKMVPQLEKLQIFILTTAKDIEVIGQNCPQLKSFKMIKWVRGFFNKSNDHALAIANNMPELRHLELIDVDMTNDGLEAILNGCPHLQSLDVRGCYNLNLYGYVGTRFMERVKDFKSDYNTDEFDYQCGHYYWDEFYED